MMTGAAPNTRWLDRCVVLDDKGFIKTGPELSQDDLSAAGWPLARPPYLLETSRPGVFAVGDVRDRKSTRLNSSHGYISYAVFCLKKKNKTEHRTQPRHAHHGNVIPSRLSPYGLPRRKLRPYAILLRPDPLPAHSHRSSVPFHQLA